MAVVNGMENNSTTVSRHDLPLLSLLPPPGQGCLAGDLAPRLRRYTFPPSLAALQPAFSSSLPSKSYSVRVFLPSHGAAILASNTRLSNTLDMPDARLA